MRKQIEAQLWTEPLAVFNGILTELDAEVDGSMCVDAPYLWPDRYLQMCSASIMYPRSDAPRSLRYAGGLPKVPRKTGAGLSERPTWWGEVVDNPAKKDIVFVCQGTVVMDYQTLVVPVMEAMKDRPNTLVVVVLGERGATLDSSIIMPENVRVADYIPFDEILPHCSVFVGNGGYGGVQHSISHGTPMVVAGVTEDKAEMCAICDWAGVARNLKTGQPTSKALRVAIDEVLSDPKFREACQRIQAEMVAADPLGVITENINEVIAGVKA